jgi:predicted nucleic acid-binding protein
MVLVDTPIWSLVFRRRMGQLSEMERAHVEEWIGLIRHGRILLVGAVRQELLSGIRDLQAFETLRAALKVFPDEQLSTEDFEEAARVASACRAAGIAGSNVDCLLCAVALRRNAAIYTTDLDFERYARHLPLRLHAPGG